MYENTRSFISYRMSSKILKSVNKEKLEIGYINEPTEIAAVATLPFKGILAK